MIFYDSFKITLKSDRTILLIELDNRLFHQHIQMYQLCILDEKYCFTQFLQNNTKINAFIIDFLLNYQKFQNAKYIKIATKEPIIDF